MGSLLFFNAETKELKASIVITDSYFKIDDNAQYFFLNNQFYELLGDYIQQIMPSELPEYVTNKHLVFNTKNNSCIAFSNTKFVVQFNFKTKTKKNLDDFINADDINYNELKDEYMIGEYHEFYDNYRDASFITLWQESTNKKRKIQVFDEHSSGAFYKYINNKIFYWRGQYLDESWLDY